MDHDEETVDSNAQNHKELHHQGALRDSQSIKRVHSDGAANRQQNKLQELSFEGTILPEDG